VSGDPATPAGQAALAAGVLAGDQAAEQSLAAHYRRRIYLMMLARVRDRDTAEELTQDTLLAALAALRKGQLRQAESLGAFIHGVGRNLVNNHLRTRRSQPAAVQLSDDMPVAVPHEDFEGAQRLALVRREIGRLEPADREILMRTLVRGEKPGQIAQEMALSPEVVRARKSRALRRVIQRLADQRILSRYSPSAHLVHEAPR
jgi:RNA polymerase sigma-70 factor (ECF subfamily)